MQITEGGTTERRGEAARMPEWKDLQMRSSCRVGPSGPPDAGWGGQTAGAGDGRQEQEEGEEECGGWW